jgi:hypothetical protein
MEKTCSKCENPIKARGMCHTHYSQEWRAGTLGPRSGIHVLTEVDRAALRGVCRECGPVKIRLMKKGRTVECLEAAKARKRPKEIRLTTAQYREMTVAQGHLCAVCRRPDRRALSVDHCHETGRIRGLLCSACNLAIGLLRDDVGILEAAIAYLSV